MAIDPLDGSSNIGVGMVVGTIFGIRPVVSDPADINASFKTPGTAQYAAGFVVYGPATLLVLTLGAGTRIFTLDRAQKVFRPSRSTRFPWPRAPTNLQSMPGCRYPVGGYGEPAQFPHVSSLRRRLAMQKAGKHVPEHIGPQRGP